MNTNSVAGWAFDAAPAVLIFTTSLCPSLITAVPACCLAMTLSSSFHSHNQAVWARAAGTDWVKLAIDVSSSALYMYRLTIRIRSDDTIRPNTNTLFGPLFGTSVRRHSMAASSIHYSAFFGGSAMPSQHTRSTGLLCGRHIALELSTRQLGRDNFNLLVKTHLLTYIVFLHKYLCGNYVVACSYCDVVLFSFSVCRHF